MFIFNTEAVMSGFNDLPISRINSQHTHTEQLDHSLVKYSPARKQSHREVCPELVGDVGVYSNRLVPGAVLQV